ncbi:MULTISPECIES: YihY/virulence factor BrkB family protein [Thermomonosporaceae]|uniref:YihY/virulence factor BrkB family protein n=1 Tax=Thermomonosporaceae TaxID=2012 RepID=UPI00255B3DE5|nr:MULTISPECIES: YihY/virulence factor BrkB family protein [Thermomonosporaceae]MDL4776157.1 YihY/virulence factor BrkB family protein [Actinomadura xylanilytica]
MPQVINEGRRRVGALTEAAKRLLRAARARWGWLDHLGRAYGRYQERRGDRLAAALTSYGFLSFFPLLALAYSLLGYLVGVSDEARDYFVRAVNSLLPGLSDQLQVQEIAKSKATVGLVGLAALLFTGLGWVQVLRESLRDIWGNEPNGDGNFLVKKLWDAAVLAFLGAALVLGMAVTTVATSTSHAVLDQVGLGSVPGAGTGLRLLSLALAVGVNTVIFLFLFSRLSGTRAPWRRIARGALFGAVGFEILKQSATLLLAQTTRNPVYASFAVLVGLMVWINFVSRFLLFAAAWTATRRVVLKADADAATEPATEPAAESEPDTESGPGIVAGPADAGVAGEGGQGGASRVTGPTEPAGRTG